MDWPRVPLPGWPDGIADGAASELAASAERGRKLAALLDADVPIDGITEGVPRADVVTITVPTAEDGGNMTSADFAVSAGWGRFGGGDVVIRGQGRVVERTYADDERAALGDAIRTLGDTTFDGYLNDRAYWRNVPTAVWDYQLGGYPVLKKWLSYRESKVLGRSLLPEEVWDFTDMSRRIGSIIQLVNRD